MEPLIRDTNRKQLFSQEQHDFINGKSCTIQLLEILEDLTEALYAGNDIDVIYLDLQKAFDKVLAQKKIWAYGIQIFSWIQIFPQTEHKQY